MSSTKLRNACGTFVAALILNVVAAHASVEISAAPTSNMNCTAGVCSPTAKKAVLNVTDLANMLAGGDVTVKTTSVAQDVEIDAALSWTSASRLTVDSYHSIAFNRPLVVAGSGALTITTNDGGAGGDFRFMGKGHVQFQNTGDSLVINGGPYVLINNIKDFRLRASHFPNGLFALAKTIISRKVYSAPPIGRFGGNLEGLGNAISGLIINSSVDHDSVAFIGEFIQGTPGTGIVRDIGLKNVQITGTGSEECVGALLGVNAATTTNSYTTGTVAATNNVSTAGGLVCENVMGTVRHSFSGVNVSSTGNNPAGGLVGVNLGGCGGSCFGLVDQSFSTGSVSAGGGGTAGGLVGQNLGGIITNSYAAGSATGSGGAFVGGLVGSNEDDSEEMAHAIIQTSYSVGSVNGSGGATIGGLLGRDIAAPGISDAYWDLDTSGISDPSRGAGNIADDPGITGLTTQQLQSGLPAGFNAAIWAQKASINNGYPYLIANPPPQ